MKHAADELKGLVAEAEAAVASVKDPELKRAAFEKVLEHLLAGGEKSTVKPQVAPRAAATPKKSKSGGGPKARVEELISHDFFKKPRTLSDVKAELANRGFHIARTSLSGPLQSLVRERKLRRQKGVAGDPGAYGYSNW